MKSKLLYILTIILTLFTFNTSVNAAQELTCVYEKGLLTNKVMFTQDADGNKIVYTNEEDKSRNDFGWKRHKGYKIDFKYKGENKVQDDSGNFITCPQYAMLSGDTLLTLTFSYSLSQELEPNGEYKELTIPELEPETIDGISDNLYCSTLKSTDSIMIEELGVYDIACVYALDISALILNTNGEIITHEGCHIIQINAKESGQMFFKQAYPALPGEGLGVSFDRNQSVNFDNFLSLNKGWCPNKIYVNNSNNNISMTTTTIGLYEETGYRPYELYKTVGKNLKNGEEYKNGTDDDTGYINSNIGSIISYDSCAELFADDDGKKLLSILKKIYNLIRIAIPTLLIGLGILDFAKAIFSGDEDKMKKAQEKFIKRVIIGVCIFLIPTIISFILEIYNSVWDKKISTDFCGILR